MRNVLAEQIADADARFPSSFRVGRVEFGRKPIVIPIDIDWAAMFVIADQRLCTTVWKTPPLAVRYLVAAEWMEGALPARR